MAITLSYTGNLTVTDSTSGGTAYTKALTALTTSGTAFTEVQTGSFGTSPTSITLPISPVTFLYVKNLHAVNTLAVTWTPNGGSTASILTLYPGAFIGFSIPISANGITALSLTGSSAGTTAEFVLGG